MNQPKHLASGKPASALDFILERRDRVVRRFLPVGGSVLLDFGCGTGAQTRTFGADFDVVLGADVDRAFLQRFASVVDRPGASGVLYDGDHLPLRGDSADLVISFEVLEHVENEHAALSEVHRVLRPGGWLAMTVPNRWWIFETHGADLPLLPWNRVPLFSWLPKDVHDRWARARIYRRREIVSLLRRHGFEVQCSRYLTAPMDVVPWQWLKRALRRTVFAPDTTPLPFLATAVFVAARKPPAGGDGP